MSDIVERLRATPNWQRQDFAKWKDAVSVYDRAPFEAADEIERLRAERDAYRDAASGLNFLEDLQKELAALRAERDALRELLREAFEWTGREPVPFDVPKVLALRKRIDAALAERET
jgi:hypothetical protein